MARPASTSNARCPERTPQCECLAPSDRRTDRLPADSLESEIQRIKDAGITVKNNTKVDTELFATIQQDNDAVVIASGAHNAVVIPFPGHERLTRGLDFLKDVNAGKNPKVGTRVIVIGAGNAGMDDCLGA